MSARFYFDLVEQATPLIDDEGTLFDDIAAATRHGQRSAREIIAHDIICGRPIRLATYLAILDRRRAEVERIYFRDVVRFADRMN